MDRKRTDKLKQELMQTNDLDQYLKKNESLFMDKTVPELLDEAFSRKGISKATLAQQSGLSHVYVYQIFAGRRAPSRDKLLCLCVGMRATIEETQSLLKAASVAALYPANRRDSIIMFGILHGQSLTDINVKLYDEDEETLS